MVNAPQMWRMKRASEVASIQSSIREGLKAGIKPEYKKILLATMSQLGISSRSAQERIDVALFNEGIEIPKDI